MSDALSRSPDAAQAGAGDASAVAPAIDSSRRDFLAHAGAGLGALSIAGGALTLLDGGTARAQAPVDRGQTTPGSGNGPGAQPPKVEFPPTQKSTERKEGGPPTPEPPDQRVGYCVIGLGRIALTQMIPGMGESKRSKLVAVMTGDPNKGRAVAAQYGLDPRRVYGYDEWDRLRDDRAVEAVYVATPNALHAEQVVRAAGAGKHVLCEKPMATNVADAERMVRACAAAGRRLMVAYRIQYEPHNRAAMRMVRDSGPGRGPLGKITLIEMANGQAQGDPTQWRQKLALAGGGALPDVGIYCFNTARFLTGEEPVEVRAQLVDPKDDPRFREVEETVVWSMRFPSGTLANCSTSYGIHQSRRYRVNGEDGWVEVDPAFSYDGLRMRAARAENGQERIAELPMSQKSQFAREADHFSQCVRENRQPYTPGEEGVQDHRVQAAIYEAARTGRPATLAAVAGKDAFRGPAPQEEMA
ncbi:glucose-fructose oxidoreductase [Gemmatimonadetes bacterium T265]|nr:glucose-fructose oxidoreductase [Gemmatimonadetes bacterium T265]